MEAPYSIATLPRPLDPEHGKIYASPVHALKGSKKRKRHEVAVAVDGEGLSVYNVQSQALVTSYAIPPQSYLCCQPCSIFCRSKPDTAAQRRTYAVLKDGANSKTRKLVCFTENVRGKKTGEGEHATPKKLECAIPDGEVCNLDSTASAMATSSSVVIAYKDGRVVSVLGDLSKVREDKAASKKSSHEEIEYSAVIDGESARKGILKNREDMLAVLDQNGAGGLRDDLLFQVMRSKTYRRVEISTLRAQGQNQLQTTRAGPQSVLSLDLPKTSRMVTPHAQHELHAASGRLYSMMEGKLFVYDLASIVPKTVTELGTQSEPIASFTRLTKSLLVAMSTNTIMVYETTYGSLLATGGLQILGTPVGKSNKRKRDGSELADVQTTTIAVSAFAEAGLFVFVSGSQLAAIQLAEDSLSRPRGKERPVQLADVFDQAHARFDRDEDRSDGRVASWIAQVDSLIEDNDIEGLETLVANDEGLGRQRKPNTFRRNKSPDATGIDTDATAYDDLWPLPEPLDPAKLDRGRALYLLGKVFSYAPDQPQAEIRIASRKLLEWLALAGFLNRKSLERALHPDDTGTQREPIRPGDIVTAISEIDDEFQFMHSLLSLPPPAQWELSEIIQALCLLIRSFDGVPESGEQAGPRLALLGASERNEDQLLTNGDVEMVNGDADSEVESESKAAETELEHVERILMSGLEVRSDTLRVILERLHGFPASDVTKTMRAMMTQKELIFLIHMLRIELADGGWTSRYTGAGADEEKYTGSSDPLLTSMVDVIPVDGETGPSNQAIRTIGDLLNWAVDAVGTSGWLVGLSGDALGTEELLDSLRAEVSAGLEGCYEANTLGTFLEELERFVWTKPKQKKGRRRQEEEVHAALPAGGKAEPTELKNKRTEGKKSKQVLALEKSKRVGKYSLDRIRF